MRPSVATVLSPREWERALVEAARRTAAVRIVGRAYEPEDLHRMGPIDIVVVGTETAWLSAPLLRAWRSRGWSVVGVHTGPDSPGRKLLERGAAEMIVDESTLPERLLHMVASCPVAPTAGPEGTRIITVTGPRGAPGRTTVAVALARLAGEGTLLLDADPLPNIGPALGMGPGPGIEEIVDRLRQDGGFDELFSRGDGLAVLCSESSGHPLAGAVMCELALSMRSTFSTVILETGPPGPDLSRMVRVADLVVLVVDGTAQGVIRAARLVADWPADPPAVVLNRIRGDTEPLVRSCRAALGLEPSVLLPRFAGNPVEAAAPFISQLAG